MTMSVDYFPILGYGVGLIDALWPIIVVPFGIILGMGTVTWIVTSIGRSIKNQNQ